MALMALNSDLPPPSPAFTSSKPGWKVGEAEPARLYPGTEAVRHRLGSDVEESQPGSTQEREAEPRRGSFCTGKAEPRMEGRNFDLGGCVRVGTGRPCALQPGRELPCQLCKIVQAPVRTLSCAAEGILVPAEFNRDAEKVRRAWGS